MARPSSDTPPKDVMGMLEYYLVTKSPVQLPENAKKWIVKYGPWIDLVLLLLALPLLLLALGISTVALPVIGVASPAVATGIGLVWIVTLVQVGLFAAAIPGLLARTKQGWMLTFYGVVVSLAVGLLSGHILNALISALLSLFILFQIRSYYK